ncbi:MAG: crosslink repair DNA glycosylase YcaQ family protein, partial [Acidobacteriota bacterium]
PALVDTLRRIESRDIKTATVDSTTASPFAAALLFGYVANYIYDGDAPLAERRAHALAIDQAQLRELLGEAELRELLDADALAEVERQLQNLDLEHHARSVDAVHDLLLRLGDLTPGEIAARSRIDAHAAVTELLHTRRAIRVNIGGEARFLPVEYAARYRDALGVPLPTGLPESLLAPAPHASQDLARRYARTHGPFTTTDFAARYALGRSTAETILKELSSAGRLLEGEFRPGGSGREWCDPDALQSIRRRSLARLRKEVEPVEPDVFGRLLTSWQGVVRRRLGLDALLDAIENLQGAPLPASTFESEILSARVDGYNPADLDALTAAGEVMWCGMEPLGDRDGRLALYLTDSLPRLRRPIVPGVVTRTAGVLPGSPRQGNDAARALRPRRKPDTSDGLAASPPALSPREQAIVTHLATEGASFFPTVHDATGGGFPNDTVEALWDLVWKGVITNDTFHALRAFTRLPEKRQRKPPGRRPFRSRRVAPPTAEGRWSLIEDRAGAPVSPTEWSTATAQQLLARYGVLTREVAAAEGISGGFSAVYDVLKAMEDAGRIRRGYFVAGVGAMQFALPAALELMRSLREPAEAPETVVLAATDPANPFGTMLKWPGTGAAEGAGGRGPTRTVGSLVVLVNGSLAAYISRGGRQILVYLAEDEPARSTVGRALAHRLVSLARGEGGRGGLLIAEINGMPAADHPFAPFLIEAGFNPSAMGFQMRRPPSPGASARQAPPSPGASARQAPPSPRASARQGPGPGSIGFGPQPPDPTQDPGLAAADDERRQRVDRSYSRHERRGGGRA